MKKMLLIAAISSFMIACNNAKSTKTDQRFIGTWKTAMTDNVSKKVIDTLTLTFTKDGNVNYSSKGPYTYQDGTTKEQHTWTEKYFLTDKETIVTIGEDKEEVRAKYRFITEDKLQIEYEDNKQLLTKVN